jgi:NADH-quinone oxidoreductase subunit A
MKSGDTEKLSAYECGFNPFDDSRSEFDVRFYIIAILFLIFDLEISFLFPFVTTLYDISDIAFYSMFYFLFILTVGFLYE